MIKRLFIITVLCLSMIALVGTDATARPCRPIAGTALCLHDICFEIDYKAMKADASAACLAVYWETVEGGICMNPAGQVPIDHPADDDSRFFHPNVGATVATQVSTVGEGGKFTFIPECFDPCEVLTAEDVNPCNNNWTFDCENPDFPLNSIEVLTWNAGYRGTPGDYTYQSGLCIRYTAEACSQDPNDPNYDPDCGSCGYVYSDEVVPEGECLAVGLIDACDSAVDAIP